MMDRKDILDNGLLELYYLDELSASEKKEIELLLAEDKELQSHYKDLEFIFESIGKENGIEPPKHIKDNLLKSIKNQNDIIEFPPENSTGNSNLYLKIAACMIPIFLLSTIWFFMKSNDLQKDLKISEQNYESLRKDLDQLKNQFDNQNALYNAINNTDVEQYVLIGNDKLPEAKLISYVNHKTKSVLVNTKALPKPKSGTDYQMWADVDGEMIDMGILKKDEDLLVMNYIDDAESLNITIEPEGGSEHPTVSNLISNVYLR